jgi:hypothetical protein
MTRKATCCCGLCSIEVEGELTINAICHCGNCKKRTGSAFGWSSYFPDAQIGTRIGDLKAYRIDGANWQERWFCTCCGTTLLWKVASVPNQTGIAGGCFVETPLAAPAVTVSNDGRCSWLRLPEGWRTSL